MAYRIAFVAAAAVATAVSALDIVVPSGKINSECFIERIEANNKLTGSFEVISGGFLDIDMDINGPNGAQLYTATRETQGHFNILAPMEGDYQICFSNRLSTSAEKVVSFRLHQGDEIFKSVAMKDEISPLENEILQLSDALDSVVDLQKFMWARERSARDTSESTNTRVLWFSVMELMVLVGISAWQIYTLRAFFERAVHT